MKEIIIKDYKCLLFNPNQQRIVVQLIDRHDLESINEQINNIQTNSFSLVCVEINDWNKELSPWPAKAVFGNDDFGEGAKDLLSFITNEVIPYFGMDKEYYLAGYSLAGLFSLWAGYNSACFKGIVAASPSVWFPNFVEYCQVNKIMTRKVYLSLGEKEEKTKNPIMSKVADNIRKVNDMLSSEIDCVLQWNPGNHFVDVGLRMAKGIEWILK